eukprot:Hpha_TRINITY_DN16887_c2_g3::TRINITY_DN16887_c2_g3_i1::g.153432::m.153432
MGGYRGVRPRPKVRVPVPVSPPRRRATPPGSPRSPVGSGTQGSLRQYLAATSAWTELVVQEFKRTDGDNDGFVSLTEVSAMTVSLWRICGLRHVPTEGDLVKWFDEKNADTECLTKSDVTEVMQHFISLPSPPASPAQRRPSVAPDVAAMLESDVGLDQDPASPHSRRTPPLESYRRQRGEMESQPPASPAEENPGSTAGGVGCEDHDTCPDTTAAMEEYQSKGWAFDTSKHAMRRNELHCPVFDYECMREPDDSAAHRKANMLATTSKRKRELLAALEASGSKFDWNGNDMALLQELFTVQNEDGTAGLREHEFVALMHAKKDAGGGEGMHPKKLFVRIDTIKDGCITWEEFSEYLVRGGAADSAEQGEDEEITPYVLTHHSKRLKMGAGQRQTYHKGRITRVVVHQDCDRYYTASEDGTVKSWLARNLKYDTTVHDAGSAHITDLIITGGAKNLIVAQRNRTVHSFTCSASGTHHLRAFVGAQYLGWECRPYHDPAEPHGPLCQLGGMPTQDVVLGEDPFDDKMVDSEGRIANLSKDMSHKVAKKMLVRRRHKEEYTALEGLTDGIGAIASLPLGFVKIDGEPLLLGTDRGALLLYGIPSVADVFLRPLKTGAAGTGPGVHATWMPHKQEITGLAVAVEKKCVVSSSLDRTIKFTSVERGHVVMKLSTESEQGGFLGFQSNTSLQMLASFSGSAKVQVWDQVAIHTERPRTVLTGHTEHVTAVLWIDKARLGAAGGMPARSSIIENQTDQVHLVTLSSADKCIKIWDAKHFRCLQTIGDRVRRWPQDALSALAYDYKRQCIVVGACAHLISFRDQDTEKKTLVNEQQKGQGVAMDFAGHLEPVRVLAYSPDFEHLVTGDSSQVIVWDLGSGERVSGFEVDAGVVRLRFDVGTRRLIVVTDSPCTVAIWDHLVGVKEREYIAKELFSVSCVVHCATELAGRAIQHTSRGSPMTQRSQHLGWMVAGGTSESLYVWLEDPADPHPQIDVYRRVPIPADCGQVRCLDAAGGRVVAGTSLGSLLVFKMEPTSMDLGSFGSFRINCTRPPESLIPLLNQGQQQGSFRRRRASSVTTAPLLGMPSRRASPKPHVLGEDLGATGSGAPSVPLLPTVAVATPAVALPEQTSPPPVSPPPASPPKASPLKGSPKLPGGWQKLKAAVDFKAALAKGQAKAVGGEVNPSKLLAPALTLPSITTMNASGQGIQTRNSPRNSPRN